MLSKCELFEQSLFDDGYAVFDRHLPLQFKALSHQQTKYIIIDPKHLRDTRDRYCTLVHERMHFELNRFYNLFSHSPSEVERKEKSVNIKVARRLVPQDILFNLLHEKKLSLHEIAESLEINEEIVIFAFNWYSSLDSWMLKKNQMRQEEW